MKQHPHLSRLFLHEDGHLYVRLEVHKDDAGYFQAQLTAAGAARLERVHRLIWEITNGKLVPDGMLVRHLNDIKSDNRPCNLALGTALDNARDRRVNGGDLLGESNHQSKLTEEAVRDIRQRVAAGESRETLAREYNVGRSTIADIVMRRTWNHIKEIEPKEPDYGHQTEEEARSKTDHAPAR